MNADDFEVWQQQKASRDSDRRLESLAELDASITSDEWSDQFVMSICPSADSTPFSSLKPCTLKALLAAIVSTPAVADPPRDHLTPPRQLGQSYAHRHAYEPSGGTGYMVPSR